jgi:hypothetical protein
MKLDNFNSRPAGWNNMESAHLMFLAQIATMVASIASALLIATLAILEKRVSSLLLPNNYFLLKLSCTMVANIVSSLLIATLAILEKRVLTCRLLCFLFDSPP